jgi:hypothetical protein
LLATLPDGQALLTTSMNHLPDGAVPAATVTVAEGVLSAP